MRRSHTYYIYSIVSGLVLLGAAACTGRITPLEDDTYMDAQIGISTSIQSLETKGLLSSMDANGTTVQVYDYLSNFNGTIVVNGQDVTHNGSDYFLYFSDVLSYPGGEGAWNYSSGNSYRWTRTGTHNFFGWILNDGASGIYNHLFFNDDPTFDTSTQTLSVPAKLTQAVNSSDSQYDFLYAMPYSVSPGNAAYGNTVNLSFTHLFTALALTIQNVSDNNVVLKNIYTEGIYTTKSAAINFRAGTITYANQDASVSFIPALQSNRALAPSTGVFTPWEGYKILWPQTGAEMENAKIVLVYDLIDAEENATEYTSTVDLSQIRLGESLITTTGLEAGKKYSLTLQFKNGSIELYPYVAPWKYSEESWSYANNSISARTGSEFHDGVLYLTKNGVAGSNYNITLESTQEVVNGEFYIYTPHHGRWQISLYPAEAAQYFTITPHEGNITEEMVLGDDLGHVTFTIRASELVPEYTVSAYFNISIYMGNEWHDANSEFNRKNWKITRVVS